MGERTREPMPPPDLEADKLAGWWRKQLEEEGMGGKIPVEGGVERQCLFCDTINPCSGTQHCLQCGKPLRGAKPRPDQPLHSPNHY